MRTSRSGSFPRAIAAFAVLLVAVPEPRPAVAGGCPVMRPPRPWSTLVPSAPEADPAPPAPPAPPEPPPDAPPARTLAPCPRAESTPRPGGGTTPDPKPAPAPEPYDGPSGTTAGRGGSAGTTPRPAIGPITPGRGPTAGGGSRPRGATPGGRRRRASSGDVFNWEAWWWNNQYRFIDFEAAREKARSSGSADFFLGSEDRANRRQADDARTPANVRDRIVPALTRALASRESDVRAAAVKALGRVADGAPVAEMEKLLDDPVRDVRFSAALALGDAGARESLPRLERIAANPREDAFVRGVAAVAIGLVGDPATAGALRSIALANDTPRDLRMSAVVALGLVPCASSRDTLRALAADEKADDDLRALAAAKLGRICGDADTVEILLDLAAKAPAQVRRSAILSLGPAAEIDARVVPFLARAAEDEKDVPARAFALVSLGESGGGPTARKALLEALTESRNEALRSFAAMGLGISRDPTCAPYLRAELREERRTPSHRSAVAVALGLLKDPESIPALASLAADESTNPMLRGYAALGLGLAGDRSQVPVIERALADRPSPSLVEPLARAAGLIGTDDALTTLLRAVESADCGGERGSLLLALGHLRDARAVEPLLGLLERRGADGSARVFAALALGHVANRHPVPRSSALTSHRNYLIATPTVDYLALLL